MQLTHPKVVQPKPGGGLKSAIEHWPSGMDARHSAEKPLREALANQANICLCLLPDMTWHKVNDPKVDYSEGLGVWKVGYEPRLETYWTILVIAPLCALTGMVASDRALLMG